MRRLHRLLHHRYQLPRFGPKRPRFDVVQSRVQAFRAALEQQGAAVLSEEETTAFLTKLLHKLGY